MPNGPLADLRVVDVTDDTGRFAGKVLAEAGASVVRIGAGFAGASLAFPSGPSGRGDVRTSTSAR